MIKNSKIVLKKEYKIWIIALSVLSLAVFLTGCGERAGGPATARKEVEITMWLVGSEGQALTVKDIAQDFYAASNIKVRCEAISWGEAHSKYLTSIAGGIVPDIGMMGLTWGSEFGALGAIVDLNRAYPGEVDAMKKRIFSGLWDSIEYNGRVFGIPFDMTECIVYYRKDIIGAPPRDWRELAALLGKLNKEGKSMIFDWGSMSWIGYSPFLWQAGGDYYNRDYSKVTIDSTAAAEALKFFSELYTKYGVPVTKIPLEQGLRTGDFPIAISGNWKIESLRLSAPEITGKWSIAKMPEGPAGKMTAFVGGRIMSVFTLSKHKEAAWQFIKFLFRPESQTKLYAAAITKYDTYLPPRKDTLEMLTMDPEFRRVLVAQADDSKGPPAVPNWDSCAEYVDEAIQRVVLQRADVTSELENAKKQIEKKWKESKN